jgi:hypothetical protein
MTDIKISVSDKLDEILQKKADLLGIKKAELVKHVVVNYVSELNSKEKNAK